MTVYLIAAGLLFNFAGILIFIISLMKYLDAAEIMLNMHEEYVLSIIAPHRRPIVQVTGTDLHLAKGKEILKWGIVISLLCLAVGFALFADVLIQTIR